MSLADSDPIRGWIQRDGLALLTDFYEITMLGGYFVADKVKQNACFEYFFRKLPPHSGFAVTAGLDPLLSFLEALRFGEADIEYLRSLKLFDARFLASLSAFRFTGDVYAAAEGTVMFPGEPLVQVVAPLLEAQVVETFLLNAMNYATLVATKAARISFAAQGEPVMEFGLRRAQGPDGGLFGTRAAYIGGCASTSNVLAGRLWGIPVRGTQAHSWIMSFPSELESFRAYAKAYPDSPILLVDTYHTIESGVPNAITVFSELRRTNPAVRAAIRLDSGDLAKLSKEAYALLAAAGFDDPIIVGSSELDEDLIADIKRQGAKINVWGVGTNLITCSDSPALGGVYKLMAIEENGRWEPRIKISQNPAKITDPGRKRIWRAYDRLGQPLGDVLGLADEPAPLAGTRVVGVDPVRLDQRIGLKNVARVEEVLTCVMQGGRRVAPAPALGDIRRHADAQISTLGDEYRRLRNPEIYRVLLSPKLAELKRRLLAEHAEA